MRSNARNRRTLRVLFMQSQMYFGSDSRMHSLLMRHFDRSQVEVHVACNAGTGSERSPALAALQEIPDTHIRPTYFGPTLNEVPAWERLKSVPQAAPLIGSLGSLAAYIKQNQIDIIHGTEKPRDALYGVLLGELTGARSVVHLHVKCEKWISPMVRLAMHRASGIIGVSDFVAKSAIDMGYRADRVYSVVNGVEATEWDPSTDGSAVRKEFGIGQDDPVLGIISRLFYWKGHLDLVKALALVHETYPRVRLLIAGEDDPRANPGHRPFTTELLTAIEQLGLEDNVIFCGFRKDVQQVLAACDLYAMPTFEEPCAVAFLEAMAMQKAIIATYSGGTPEEVEHGRSGLLSQPHDIEELAANIVMLLGDPEMRKQMGEYGRSRVISYLNPARMAEEVTEIYRRILAI